VLVNRFWTALTNCLDDYTVDSRGDVGSWIRIAACSSLVPIFQNSRNVDIRLTIAKLLRLSVEKMDRVRTAAGESLCALIPLWPDAEDVLQEFITR
jgi:tubulin-specific chaperone D